MNINTRVFFQAQTKIIERMYTRSAPLKPLRYPAFFNAYDGDERRLTGNERQRRIINEQEEVIRLMRGTINLIESEVAELRAAEPCHWSARTGEMIDRQHARAKALKS